MAYKSAQARALVLRGAGWGPEQVKVKVWEPHHQWAGKAMYQLCIDLRGFYLKVKQLDQLQHRHATTCKHIGSWQPQGMLMSVVCKLPDMSGSELCIHLRGSQLKMSGPC